MVKPLLCTTCVILRLASLIANSTEPEQLRPLLGSLNNLNQEFLKKSTNLLQPNAIQQQLDRLSIGALNDLFKNFNMPYEGIKVLEECRKDIIQAAQKNFANSDQPTDQRIQNFCIDAIQIIQKHAPNLIISNEIKQQIESLSSVINRARQNIPTGSDVNQQTIVSSIEDSIQKTLLDNNQSDAIDQVLNNGMDEVIKKYLPGSFQPTEIQQQLRSLTSLITGGVVKNLNEMNDFIRKVVDINESIDQAALKNFINSDQPIQQQMESFLSDTTKAVQQHFPNFSLSNNVYEQLQSLTNSMIQSIGQNPSESNQNKGNLLKRIENLSKTVGFPSNSNSGQETETPTRY